MWTQFLPISNTIVCQKKWVFFFFFLFWPFLLFSHLWQFSAWIIMVFLSPFQPPVLAVICGCVAQIDLETKEPGQFHLVDLAMPVLSGWLPEWLWKLIQILITTVSYPTDTAALSVVITDRREWTGLCLRALASVGDTCLVCVQLWCPLPPIHTLTPNLIYRFHVDLADV